jgi:hypothetical protein
MAKRFTIAHEGEGLAEFLPRAGAVVAQFSDGVGNADWRLLALDDPFEYEVKVGEPFLFRIMIVTHFLIRPRWFGNAVGVPERLSVFVLLVDQESVPKVGPIDVDAYVFAAWGECRTATGA